MRSAVEEHQKLQESIFPEFQVGLLHGRMSSAEKDEAINKSRDNKTHILVSTTVVEVGVDAVLQDEFTFVFGSTAVISENRLKSSVLKVSRWLRSWAIIAATNRVSCACLPMT